MKSSILLFSMVFYSSPLLADAQFFKCTIDGVATFQAEPCQEMLNGEHETEAAKKLQIDPNKNSVSKPENVTSDVIERAKKSGKYYNDHSRSSPRGALSDNSSNQYDLVEDQGESEEVKKKAKCEEYLAQKKQLHSVMKNGYNHARSKHLHKKRRGIEKNISKFCY